MTDRHPLSPVPELGPAMKRFINTLETLQCAPEERLKALQTFEGALREVFHRQEVMELAENRSKNQTRAAMIETRDAIEALQDALLDPSDWRYRDSIHEPGIPA